MYEVSNLAKIGVREVILLGQNVNAYKGVRNKDNKCISFSELIRYVSRIPGIERIRHTTSHPIDFTDDSTSFQERDSNILLIFFHK